MSRCPDLGWSSKTSTALTKEITAKDTKNCFVSCSVPRRGRYPHRHTNKYQTLLRCLRNNPFGQA